MDKVECAVKRDFQHSRHQARENFPHRKILIPNKNRNIALFDIQHPIYGVYIGDN